MKKFEFLLLVVCCVLACAKQKQADSNSPQLESSQGVYMGQYASLNKDFEEDWASQREITLVTSYYKENDKPVVKTIDVPLPWAWDLGPQQWLPQYTARNMAFIDSKDWRLVFNLTGIEQKPGEHFFALYNRYTGTLRVFYYLTEDRIPPSDANDHMWSMGFSKDLLEHIIFQYAIPYGETVPEDYKAILGGNDALFKTTALTSACTDQGKVVPAIGWWAYDIDMSMMRPHDFFSSDKSIMRPGMTVSHEDNVVLNSLMHGSLDGSFSGNMNLNSLKGSGTTAAGRICGSLGGFLGPLLTHNKILEEMFDGFGEQSFTAIIGLGLGSVGKGLEGFFSEGVKDPDKLGDFNGKINLTLDASIETVGTIGGERTTLVPSPELNVAAFIKQKTEDGEPTGLGEGIWNIEKHPVIYVVKDAFWGNKAKFSSVEKVESEGRTAYQVTVNPDNLGLRLISFMDPSSIGGVRINPNAKLETVEELSVKTTYGVMNGATPGYTQGFRKAIGLEYTNPILTEKSVYQTDEKDIGFKIIKKNHADPVFLAEISEDTKEYLGNRLSEQKLGEKIHRRMFGASAFFCNENAGPDEVDDVALVSDPEVFLPVNSEDRLLFGTEIPDYLVTAVLTMKGKEDGEDVVMFHSLCFVPKIEFIELKELPALYQKIEERCKNLPSDGVTYPHLEDELSKIKDIVDNAK